jgi:hypothetical protein
MGLAIGAPNIMQRLPRLPTPPNIRYLRGGKSRPPLLTHSNTILKPQVYQMMLHRPIECTALTGQVDSTGCGVQKSPMHTTSVKPSGVNP